MTLGVLLTSTWHRRGVFIVFAMGKKVKHTAIQSLSTIRVSTLTKLKRETGASEICETRHFESVVVLLFAYNFIFLYYLTQIGANKSAEQNEIRVSRQRRVAGMSKWALLRNGAPSCNSLTVFDIHKYKYHSWWSTCHRYQSGVKVRLLKNGPWIYSPRVVIW